ncbi:glutaredoxin family protein [Halapricum hydrolyticum]|uniref:Glutaredoxin family protein n=1 Tax=Halapricum hydrolyticum TaxID=2979991 RepID=A0AAE3IA50_9EURY|nr:glutaredoxin family protein [Halapricum hydrolyticum]MCU4718222.1 glutaredoxin family protein [Halapricum hydrolyticum]MCU4726337.1 glutaredoxin family protein [Halapricum hydrolyticum]
MTDPVPITVYRRQPCELCEEAIETIESVASAAEITVEIETVDVDGDPDLRERYGDRVPVVAVDGLERFELFVDETELAGALRDAS